MNRQSTSFRMEHLETFNKQNSVNLVEPSSCFANAAKTANNSPGAGFSMSRLAVEKALAKANMKPFSDCVNISKYEKLIKIGQGTFGEVFKARDRKTGKFVATKKILMENENEGFPITAIREIKILQHLKHRNIVNLIEICQSEAQTSSSTFTKPTFHLIFEFCEHDLAGLITSTIKFSLGEIKMIVKQLLDGLFFMHHNKILHRDMKAANILITKEGTLKIADFGLSRPFSSGQQNKLTNRVVTLWYRPPELLLGGRNYGPPIDIWGAGCIMAELWTRVPILQGTTEQHQLKLISDLCGSITPETLPRIEDPEIYPLYPKLVLQGGIKRKAKERLRGYMKDNEALDLFDKMLTLDPTSRIDADCALNHDFFWNEPYPCPIDKLLTGLTKSQFEYNRRRNNQVVNAPHQPRRNDDQYYDLVY